MRYLLTLLLLLASFHAKSQLVEDFSDGDFTNNPSWQGQSGKFQVVSEALQLNNAPISDEAYLTTEALTKDSTFWSFRVQLDFAPSANNRVRVYLVTNSLNLNGPLDGYFVQIGETGSQDGVDLYRQDGSNITRIIDGMPATAANNPDFLVEVIRNKQGEWSLWIDSAASGNLQWQGQAIDTTYNLGAAIGVWCKHTSSNNQAFTFDDFTVSPLFVDTLPPVLTNVTVVDSQQLELRFNENISAASALSVNNYAINRGIGQPQAAQFVFGDSSAVRLSLSSPLTSPNTYQVTVSNIADKEGNILNQASLSFVYYRPQFGDIRINECMPDPSPPRGWPEAEFIELFNRMPISISLSDWSISDGSSSAVLPDQEIPALGYVVLVDEADVSQFPSQLPIVSVDGLPALNNSGDAVILSTNSGLVMDRVDYTVDWYGDPNKEDGGWSLELLDAESDCPGRTNWRASIDPTGATPGIANSWVGQFVDTTGPALQSVVIADTNRLTLTFSEAIDTQKLSLNQITLQPGLINPSQLIWQGVSREVVDITFSVALDTGQLYQLVIEGATDCRGNAVDKPLMERVLIPLPLELQDLIVNEILFNPSSGGADYVELYNRSQKTVNLEGLILEELDANTGAVIDDIRLSESVIMEPGEYVAITSDREAVLLDYFTPNPVGVIESSGFPNFPDDEGGVRLLSREGVTIDSMSYNEDWHFRLIDDVNGVSLERIDPEASSTASQNWYSASSTVGYGTPAYQNSQFQQIEPFEGVIEIDPETVSPDGDGYQDQLVIAYAFTQPGYMGTVHIMDSKGRLVRELLRSSLLEQSGTLLWDGLLEEGRKADPGIYIVYFEVFNLQGEVKRYKHRCVVAERW